MAELTGLASPTCRAAFRVRIEFATLLLVGIAALGAGIANLVRPSGSQLDGTIFLLGAAFVLSRLVRHPGRHL